MKSPEPYVLYPLFPTPTLTETTRYIKDLVCVLLVATATCSAFLKTEQLCYSAPRGRPKKLCFEGQTFCTAKSPPEALSEAKRRGGDLNSRGHKPTSFPGSRRTGLDYLGFAFLIVFNMLFWKAHPRIIKDLPVRPLSRRRSLSSSEWPRRRELPDSWFPDSRKANSPLCRTPRRNLLLCAQHGCSSLCLGQRIP